MRRKMNDGNQDESSYRSGYNTMGGPYAENRGRRSADGVAREWESSPFEDGQVSSWNHRKGWDSLYDRSYDRSFRRHGGNLIGHDLGHRGKGPKGYRRSDESIYRDVCDMLARSPDVDAGDIEVAVKDGCVYLSGTVHDRQMKKMAEYEIENISGIRDVQNQLTLEPPRGGELH